MEFFLKTKSHSKSSVAESEPVEPKLFGDLERSQFGGCQDVGKLIFTSMSIVLLLENSFMWQCMAVAGDGAEIKDKGRAGNK